jgi:hypothetical protein
MEPRPPKPPRSTPRQPQQQQPSWDPAGQPAPSNQPPAGNRRDSGYPGSNRYPEYPPYDQQQPGYGRGPAYPPPGQNQQPGYGQQPPADPYAGYQRPIYPPAGSQGSYPASYPGNTPDPYAGYGGQQPYPPQPGSYPPAQTGQLPVQAPAGRSGSGGWIAPLPDEELSSIQPSPYGGGYGGGGFSGDPRSGRAAPGPNRQTQIIAALAIGGLALMILAIVIGFIIFGGDDDDPGDTPTSVAGVTTDLTPTTTTDAAQNLTPTAPAGESAVTPTTAPATETATEEAQNSEPTAAPTEAPDDTTDEASTADSGLIAGDDGESLLLSVDELPLPGFFINDTVDERLSRADVASSLGDSEASDGPIDQALRANGFAANWRREFDIDATTADPEQTSVFFISISIFRSTQGAADSMSIYTDAATAIGNTEVDGEQLGDQSMTFESEDGTSVTIYVLQDNVIFRFYGYSAQGDPTADVVALAQAALAKMP